MKSKILLVLAVICFIALPAYAAVQNVKIGGDLTMLGIIRNNFDLKQASPDAIGGQLYQDDRDLFASQIRIRLDADLTENVAATLRLLNERDWDAEGASTTDIDIDLAYVSLKEFMMSPLTVTVGRQELHFGNDLIVGDPTRAAASGANDFDPSDLSLRKGFDAVRLTYDLSQYAPVMVDAIYAQVSEGTTTLNDDTTLMGVNARYKFDEYNAIAEGYWFAKKTQSSATGPAANSTKAEYIHNLGARGSIDPIEDLTVQLEAAYQFGDYTGGAFGSTTQTPGERSAWIMQTLATYKLPVLVEYVPIINASFTYASGEDEKESTDGEYHAWDSMYENQTSPSMLNALLYLGGMTAAGDISIKPIEDLTVKLMGGYSWLTSDYKTGSTIPTPTYADSLVIGRGDETGLGFETDVILTYDYTEDVQLGLQTGVFLPGPAFETRTLARDYDIGNSDTAWETIASMKVVF